MSKKFGIIGCGNFGNFHITNLLQMNDIEIIALYNRGSANLERASEKVPNARKYQDVAQMLETEDLDAVIISLLPDTHGEVEKICCEKGIHMFIEKPIALNMETAVKINELIENSKSIVSVGYHERYSDCIEIIKEIIKNETICLIQSSWIGNMPGVSWWRQKEQSGGQVVEQATHIIDILRYLVGEITSVYTIGVSNDALNFLPNNVEDYTSSIFTFDTGVVASLQTGCYINSGLGKVGFEIITPKTKIEYVWGKHLQISTKQKIETINVSCDPHIPALENFVLAVKTGDSSLVKSSYSDAMKSLNISLLANNSMETGLPIKL